MTNVTMRHSKGAHFKICFLGKSGSGKTRLCFFLTSQIFPPVYRIYYFGIEKQLARKQLSTFHLEFIADLSQCASVSHGLLIWDDFNPHCTRSQALLERILSVTSHHFQLSVMVLCQEFRSTFLSKHMASFHAVLMPLVNVNKLLCYKVLQNLRMSIPNYLHGFFEKNSGCGIKAVNIRIDTNTVLIMSFPMEAVSTETPCTTEFAKLLNDKAIAFVNYILSQKPQCFDSATNCFAVQRKLIHVADLASKLQNESFRSLVRRTPDHEVKIILLQLAKEKIWIPHICFL